MLDTHAMYTLAVTARNKAQNITFCPPCVCKFC